MIAHNIFCSQFILCYVLLASLTKHSESSCLSAELLMHPRQQGGRHWEQEGTGRGTSTVHVFYLLGDEEKSCFPWISLPLERGNWSEEEGTVNLRLETDLWELGLTSNIVLMQITASQRKQGQVGFLEELIQSLFHLGNFWTWTTIKVSAPDRLYRQGTYLFPNSLLKICSNISEFALVTG